MATILEQIVERKRAELAGIRTIRREWPPTLDFTAALQAGSLSVIAEVKKASPSAGVLRENFDPVAIARKFEAHGAAALSVLTDQYFFQGSLENLIRIRAAVKLPLLRKEFILDPVQLFEAREAGADAVLLIAEILPGGLLKELYSAAKEIGLHVLVELHDAEQLDRVLALNPRLIGINNRDLRTFQTRLSHTLDLMPFIPGDVSVVSESGIRTKDDLDRLQAAGVAAVLVGESLIRQPDVGLALQQLIRG